MDRYSILLGKEPPPIKASPEKKPILKPVDAKEDLLREMLRTGIGRQRLVFAMTEPMQQRLEAFSIARRVFLVDSLSSGALAINNENGIAYAVGEEGRTVVRVPPNGIIPMFEIVAHPSIPIRQLAHNRFDSIERTQEQALNEIRAMEVECTRMVFETAVDIVTPREREHKLTRNLRVPRLTSEAMVDGFCMIERNDLRLANMFMNTREYADIRRLMRDYLDAETHPEILSMGLMGMLWGANIFVSSIFPAGRIYFTAEPEFVGRMLLRDITVFSADNPVDMTVGWLMSEAVGICCTNPLGVACITISE